MYDREKTKIGFWKTDCAELWERLQISVAPPPMAPNTEERNSTKSLEPSVAPSVSQHNVTPGIISCSSLIYLKVYSETSGVNMYQEAYFSQA